jgi:ribA/ribD-fused uncharacterized protein
MAKFIIDDFHGENFFLDNFFPSVVYAPHPDGDEHLVLQFTTVEAAFQAYKTTDIELRKSFQYMSPDEAKHKGNTLELREDWQDIKVGVMYEFVRQKFFAYHSLAKKLIATNNIFLMEGNTWDDTTWGVCDGEGENLLGQVLMMVRSELNLRNRKWKNGFENLQSS